MAIVRVDTDGVQYFDITPGEHLDYTAEHTDFLSNITDYIVSAVWSVETSGLAFTSVSFTSTQHVGWVSPSAGNATTNYNFISKIFTAGGRIKRVKARLKVGAV